MFSPKAIPQMNWWDFNVKRRIYKSSIKTFSVFQIQKKSVVRCLLSVDFSYLWRSLIFKKYEVKS